MARYYFFLYAHLRVNIRRNNFLELSFIYFNIETIKIYPDSQVFRVKNNLVIGKKEINLKKYLFFIIIT
jgi:hypothetical protein